MFTIQIEDEGLYQLFLDKVALHEGSADAAMREWLQPDVQTNGSNGDNLEGNDIIDGETGGQRLARLIEESGFTLDADFDGSEAEDLLAREYSEELWRDFLNYTGQTDNDGVS